MVSGNNSRAPLRATPCAGFTLVELSVVLAVIGLLVGGVLGAQYMIRRTQIQAVVAEFGKYQHAYNQFKNQYSGLPGDITDATEYWGTDPDGCPTHTNRVYKRETCNGDGSGLIGYSGTGCSGGTVAELFRAWQHLANAGMIEGSFTGVAGSSGTNDAVLGQNSPTSRLNPAGYSIISWGNHVSGSSCSTSYYPAYYGTSLLFGTRLGSLTFGGALTPREARNVDAKLDDGKPASGMLMTYESGINPGCTTSDTAASAEYGISQNRACAFIYILESY